MQFATNDLLTLFLAVLVLALKPGPYMMAFASMSLKGQWQPILIFWIGSVVAGTLLYAVLLGGMSMIPIGFGIIFLFIKCAAALMFITWGFQGLSGSNNLTTQVPPGSVERLSTVSGSQTLFSGFLPTLSNPFDIIFIMTAVPAIMQVTQFSISDIAVIRGVVEESAKPKLLQVVNTGASIILIGIGLLLLANILMQQDLYSTNLISPRL